MYGPEHPGKWSSLIGPSGATHQFLSAGVRYRVLREFVDFDKDVHTAGEEWTFLGHSFIPYDDGMSFFVSLDGVREWQIPLQWRPEQQGEILSNLASYVAAVDQTK